MNPTLALLLTLSALLSSATSPLATVEREAWVMGTRLGIVTEAERESVAGGLAETVLAEVERFEDLLSTWTPETPLSRLNRVKPNEWVEVDPELAALLSEAQHWVQRTGGTFEPRIGALVDAWDSRGGGRVPSPAELSRSLEATGDEALQIDGHRVRRASPAAWIDSGAFGKGAALRSAARLLLRSPHEPDAGVTRAMVDLGGQLLLIAPREHPWAVEVAHPIERSRAVATLTVQHGSVATSGTSERGRHVLDPRTGRPVEPWGSVTVVHRDPFVADVLSTALFVMGPEEGLRWARREGVSALFLEPEAHRVRARWTPELEPALRDLRGLSENHEQPTSRNP